MAGLTLGHLAAAHLLDRQDFVLGQARLDRGLAGWNGMQSLSQIASAAARPSAQAAMMLSGLMTTSPPA